MALALAATTIGAPARAQPGSDAPVVFLEKAYFSLLSPTGKNLLFEGQPTVHYFLRNTLADQVWQRDGGFQWTLPVSAVFQVRMTDTTSEPVRTPSYRIRPLYAQLLWLQRPSDRTVYRLFGVSGGFTHFSNGQAGCTYLGFARNAAGDCVVSNGPLAALRQANTVDGDFSTSYWSLAAHWRDARQRRAFEPMVWQYSISLEGQLHPYDISPGGMNREQAETWGHHEWLASAEYERRHATWSALRWLLGSTLVSRAAVAHEHRFGGPASVTLDRTQYELSIVSDRAESVGAFLRYHRGFDYYNIQYQNTRPFWAFGLLWDVARFDRLNSPAAP
jgi:hypothetical protein